MSAAYYAGRCQHQWAPVPETGREQCTLCESLCTRDGTGSIQTYSASRQLCHTAAGLVITAEQARRPAKTAADYLHLDGDGE
jgi:hypothetical protein